MSGHKPIVVVPRLAGTFPALIRQSCSLNKTGGGILKDTGEILLWQHKNAVRPAQFFFMGAATHFQT
jgi:hypothetical protein